MSTITRTKDRIKQTGEVFTPLTLVDEILSKLPPDTWDPSKTYLDPAAGDGNFLVRVIAHKIHKGSTAEQALSTTYGVELMDDNAAHARQRVLTNAFVAQLWKQHSDDLLDHLTPEQERDIGLKKSHDEFCRQYNHIVKQNIICHDALTYCYRFGNADDAPRKESIGKCQCGVCQPVDDDQSTWLENIS